MKFLPREEKFFALFNKQAGLIAEAATLLREGVQNGLHKLPEAAARIQVLEEEGDELSSNLSKTLGDTFITPIDPEDIQTISSRMDSVLNGIEDTAHRLVAYKVHPVPAPMLEQCDIILAQANALKAALAALSKDQAYGEFCQEIIRLEERADVVDRSAVSRLFDTEPNPILVMKQREIYEFLEATTDSCLAVAVALQYVAAKNS
ncbi:phosphate transport regulator [Bryobacterales bacterium F-183]|nr:phosphate transport regulator [Bryobacterales bacterium F-183]